MIFLWLSKPQTPPPQKSPFEIYRSLIISNFPILNVDPTESIAQGPVPLPGIPMQWRPNGAIFWWRPMQNRNSILRTVVNVVASRRLNPFDEITIYFKIERYMLSPFASPGINCHVTGIRPYQNIGGTSIWSYHIIVSELELLDPLNWNVFFHSWWLSPRIVSNLFHQSSSVLRRFCFGFWWQLLRWSQRNRISPSFWVSFETRWSKGQLHGSLFVPQVKIGCNIFRMHYVIFGGFTRWGFIWYLKGFFWWSHVCPDVTTSNKGRERFLGLIPSLRLDLVQFSLVWFAFFGEILTPQQAVLLIFREKCRNQAVALLFFYPCSVVQAEVATDMLKAIPQRALEIILTDKFAGADLVILESEIHRPSFKDRWKILFGRYCLFHLGGSWGVSK